MPEGWAWAKGATAGPRAREVQSIPDRKARIDIGYLLKLGR